MVRICSQGLWFEVDGKHVSLEGVPLLRRVVRALALARLARRGARWDHLVAAAFPDAPLFTAEVRMRLLGVLGELCERGLACALLEGGEVLALDPDATIVVMRQAA
jgi:hypothetical protein